MIEVCDDLSSPSGNIWEQDLFSGELKAFTQVLLSANGRLDAVAGGYYVHVSYFVEFNS